MRLPGSWRAVAAMWWVFCSVGVLIPLQPRYVRQELAASDSVVGLTFLVFAVAGVVARPAAGVYLRSRDPWPLMAASCGGAAAALALTPAVQRLWWLLLLRFVEGVAVGLFYTAAATSVVQSTPPTRRGRALSYFSVPLFLGTAVGPMIGDWLIAELGLARPWVVAGALLGLALPFCLRRSRVVGSPPLRRGELLRTLAHPSAAWPALIMALMVSGWASFQAYVPLYGPQLNLHATGTLFLAYSGVVLIIRVGGARLFDLLPPVELVLVGAGANVVGLLVAWLWRDALALYLAACLMAVAIGTGYTTLMRVALTGVPAHEEGAVVGAYSVAYDIGAGAGPAVMGALVAWAGSYASAFAGGALAGAVAFGVALRHLWPLRHRYVVIRPAS